MGCLGHPFGNQAASLHPAKQLLSHRTRANAKALRAQLPALEAGLPSNGEVAFLPNDF